MTDFSLRFAEREGFEPPVPLGTPVFKTGVIDHSTISPCKTDRLCGLFASAKVGHSYVTTKCFADFFLKKGDFFVFGRKNGDFGVRMEGKEVDLEIE